ncbi:MAG: hypothetical protein QXE19_04095 [Candidatus Bathyarchaeia archaeon]
MFLLKKDLKINSLLQNIAWNSTTYDSSGKLKELFERIKKLLMINLKDREQKTVNMDRSQKLSNSLQ